MKSEKKHGPQRQNVQLVRIGLSFLAFPLFTRKNQPLVEVVFFFFGGGHEQKETLFSFTRCTTIACPSSRRLFHYHWLKKTMKAQGYGGESETLSPFFFLPGCALIMTKNWCTVKQQRCCFFSCPFNFVRCRLLANLRAKTGSGKRMRFFLILLNQFSLTAICLIIRLTRF